MNAGTVTRVFNAERAVLSQVRRFVADEAGRLSFSDFVDDLKLAVTEACANAIVHADTDEIRVSVATAGSCIEITVEDDGVYRRKLPTTGDAGHRGLFLMAAIVDDLSLRGGTDSRPGTVVRLVKCKV